MARPPLPEDQRRGRYVGLRLTEREERDVQTVADAEHDGNLSAAIRALFVDALTARAIRTLRPNLAPERVDCEACVCHPDSPGCAPR